MTRRPDLGESGASVRSGLRARATLAVASFLLAALAVEVALRLGGFNYSPMAIKSREALADTLPATKGDARALHLFQDDHFAYDPVLLWRPRAGRSVFNSLGYRGPEVGRDKPPGEIRVLALGDSNTLGWSGAGGPNWPEDLGALLAKTGYDFEVINAGVWGYTVYQGERRLREFLPLRPDLVLVSFGSNDAHSVFVSDAEYARRLSGRQWPLISGLKIGELLAAVSDRARTSEGAAEERVVRKRVPLGEYQEHLRRIAGLGREKGFAVAFLTRPYRGRSLVERHWKRSAPEYREATRRIATEEGVHLIDVYAEFAARHELFKDESHFTSLGHRAAAKFVYDSLTPILTGSLSVEPGRLLPRGPDFKAGVTLDFGTTEGRRSLGSGFAGRELFRGRTAVKSNRALSVVELALEPTESPYLLSIEARPFRRARSVEVAATLNGLELGTFRVQAEWRTYSLPVPSGVLRPGLNRLELGHAAVQADSSPDNGAVVLYDRLRLAASSGAADATP